MIGPAGDDVEFGELLRRHRVAAGLSQERLAEVSGVATRTVRNLELGRVRRPRLPTARDLADGLGLTTADRDRFLRVARTTRRLAVERGYRPLPWVCPVPDDLPDFVGRAAEFAALTALASGAPTPVTAVLTGQGGVGKSSLVVRTAHHLAPRFPHGARYLDLRGVAPTPLPVPTALHRLLRSLGVPEAQVPAQPEDRLALYRSLAGERGGVLVLDNAADEDQVRPLVPRAGGWLVLVTGRRSLSGLPAATRLSLDLLAPEEARAFLAGLVGPGRVGDPAAVADLVELCGRLPLALRIAGQRLASRPQWTVDDLAVRLRDEQRRLSALSAGDLQLRASFAVSYEQLDPGERTVFRRLPLVPVDQYTPELAAVLSEVDEDTARRAFAGLVDIGLAHRSPVGDRYLLHDLVRLFAHERALEEDDGRDAAVERARRRLLETAIAAGRTFDPDTGDDEPAPLDTGTGDAMTWLDEEQAAWTWALRRTADTGLHAEVLAAAEALHWYSDRRPFQAPWREVFERGIAAAVALRDTREEVLRRNQLGWTLVIVESRLEDALAEHHRALALCGGLDDRRLTAWTRYYCGGVARYLGRLEDAAEHHSVAVELFGRDGYPLGVAVARKELATCRWRQDRPDEAAAILADALTSWHRDGAGTKAFREVEALLLLESGRVANARGRYAEGVEHLTASVAAYRQVLHAFSVPRAQRELAQAQHRLGRTAEAVATLGEALALVEQDGDVPEQARILRELGALHRAAGDPAAAREAWLRAAELCASLDLPELRTLAAEVAADLTDAPGPPRS
ncbi:ATP-binding protein [Actinosynnema sp. NPDC053489]|uniref:ATP-binding protein n=1 Tax=Actinosynnema sp. NPDC053489 TaxID=3363916 RepID=UPI0037C7189E